MVTRPVIFRVGRRRLDENADRRRTVPPERLDPACQMGRFSEGSWLLRLDSEPLATSNDRCESRRFPRRARGDKTERSEWIGSPFWTSFATGWRAPRDRFGDVDGTRTLSLGDILETHADDATGWLPARRAARVDPMIARRAAGGIIPRRKPSTTTRMSPRTARKAKTFFSEARRGRACGVQRLIEDSRSVIACSLTLN